MKKLLIFILLTTVALTSCTTVSLAVATQPGATKPTEIPTNSDITIIVPLHFFSAWQDASALAEEIDRLSANYDAVIIPYTVDDVSLVVSPDYMSYLNELQQDWPQRYTIFEDFVRSYWEGSYSISISAEAMQKWLAETEDALIMRMKSILGYDMVETVVNRADYSVVTVYVDESNHNTVEAIMGNELQELSGLMLRYQCLSVNSRVDTLLSVKNKSLFRLLAYEERENGLLGGGSLRLPKTNDNLFSIDLQLQSQVVVSVDTNFFFEDYRRDPLYTFEEWVYELSLQNIMLGITDDQFTLTMTEETYEAWREAMMAEIIEGFIRACALEAHRGLTFFINDDITVIELRDDIDDTNSTIQTMLLQTFNLIRRYQRLSMYETLGFRVIYINKDRGVYRDVDMLP